jgi:hypothetical protein
MWAVLFGMERYFQGHMMLSFAMFCQITVNYIGAGKALLLHVNPFFDNC